MPSDISAVAAYVPQTSVSSKSVPDSAPISQAAPTASTTGSRSPAPQANPVSLLDPSTGLVVLEFHNAKGDETTSLPTKRQLELYRLNQPSLNALQPAIQDPKASAPAATAGSKDTAATPESVPASTDAGTLPTHA